VETRPLAGAILATLFVGAVALASLADGKAAPAQVEARSCVQRAVALNVQILGDRDADFRVHNGSRFHPFPDRRTLIAVWSLGGPVGSGGIAFYGWIARSRARLSSLCSDVRPRPESATAGLRRAARVKDGWFAGTRFVCQVRGRFRVQVRSRPSGRRIIVVARTGAVVAVGEVSRGGGWLRGSKRCAETTS
jgi:hypothetical protein